MNEELIPWFQAINNCAVEQISVRIVKSINAIMGFRFPAKFSLRNDFLAGKDSASATAYFFTNNLAKINVDGETREVTWLVAYDKIARSSFGPRVIPSPSDVTEAFPEFIILQKKIAQWEKKLSEIPCVSVSSFQGYSNHEGSNIVFVVKIPESFYDIMAIINENKTEGNSEALLFADGRVSWTYKITKQSADEILIKYAGNYISWESFYSELNSYLNELYQSFFKSVPKVKIEKVLASFPKRINLGVEAFKNALVKRFKYTGVKIVDIYDEESGRLFSVYFPMSIGNWGKRLTTEGIIDFYSWGKASFRIDESGPNPDLLANSLPFRKVLEPILEENISWIEAFENLAIFLNALSDLVPGKIKKG